MGRYLAVFMALIGLIKCCFATGGSSPTENPASANVTVLISDPTFFATPRTDNFSSYRFQEESTMGPTSKMSTTNQTVVKIGEETFSILEPPPTGALVVKKQKDILLGLVNLQSLVRDLEIVGRLIRLAYNGVAGYTELQIEIRKITYDVTKLCDKSAVTVGKFKQASGTILEDLQGTYLFLIDGLEDMALDTLYSVTDVAKDMAAAANQLHKDFDEASEQVETALKHTLTTKGSEEKRKLELEELARDYNVTIRKVEQKQAAAEEDYELYAEKYAEAEEREETYQSKATNPFKALANAFLSPILSGRKVFDTDADLESSKQAREEKLAFLQEMKKQREIRSNALQDIAEFTRRIENCKDDSDLAEVAIGALHQAMGGLKKLSAVMLKAAVFWKQMQVHCEQLAMGKVQRMITTAMKRPQEERLNVWTHDAFKKRAVMYYAQWVALDEVCAIYMQQIKETQRALYAYLEENFTLAEARVKVHELAKTFGKELEMEQKAIKDKDSADSKEIKRLTSNK